MKEPHGFIRDEHQTSWQLASIQLTGFTSLPVITTSILLLRNNSFSSAVITLFIGNILLWFIRLGIIKMSFRGKKSTLDISRDYLGQVGGYFIAVVLLASTLAWFIAQTTLAADSLNLLMPLKEGEEVNQFIQISVVLGICSTLLCMEGMPVLKWLSLISLPILMIAFIVAILITPINFSLHEKGSISLANFALILGTNLGITADIPTFFRHSNSWKSSVHALTIIQIVSFFLGVGALFLASIIIPELGLIYQGSGSISLKAILIIFVFLSVICANVSNVYSASVGWEVVAPILAGRKEYLILGLSLTIIFILVANIFSMEFLLRTTDVCLINLSLVLLISFILRKLAHHSPDSYEKVTYFFAWFISSVINILQIVNVIDNESTLLFGIGIIIGVIFLGMLIKKSSKKLRYRLH